ncbi:helix-hairpin-helix domain-containing protein [Prosthecochloris sp.]|uniref:ComEA family DNA-binding protein n=1 Tax=Prosthecochloris sp. TaxID=290513 RepID=UPI0025D03A58|nr:helix-hairpin-helix domain-containing protein [Prosthecochloris sp.]
MSLSSFLSRHHVVAALFFIVFCSIPHFLPASVFAEDDIQALFDQSDMPGDIEQLLYELEKLKKQKIPVNTATAEDLLLIPFLTPDDARSIILFREENGQLTAAEQLDEVLGTDMARRIAPYLSFTPVTMKAREEKAGISGVWYSRYFSEIPERQGIAAGKYRGDNYKLYNRLSVTYDEITLNGVMEKDVGEPEIDDFTSLSMVYNGSGAVEQFIVGNYTVAIGQGLLFGQSRYFSKGVDPLGVKLSGRRLKAYASSAENGFMQGTAVSFDLKPFRLTTFYSSNEVDATIKDGVVTTIRTSGYHRTDSEIDHWDNVTEKVLGMNLLYTFRSGETFGKVGGTWARYDYSVPLEATGGNTGWEDMGSIEADVLIGKVNVFAEAAMTGKDGNVSWIGGVDYPITSGIRTVLAVRDYHDAFFSPFAGAFAERADDAANEEGYYIGLEADILKNLHVGAYYDIFRFPELSSRYRLPSTGDESKLFLTWKQSPVFTTELLLQNQYKEEAKKLFDGTGLEYYQPVPFTSNKARLDLIGKVSRNLTLRTRGEIKFVEGEYPAGDENSDGWLLYQQAVLKKGPLAFKARYTRFETDDYDSAIYVYEDDLPLVFTLKSYYGKGEAFFALLSYDLWKNFELTARYAKTWYDDRDAYGSGNDRRDTSAPASYHLGCALRF